MNTAVCGHSVQRNQPCTTLCFNLKDNAQFFYWVGGGGVGQERVYWAGGGVLECKCSGEKDEVASLSPPVEGKLPPSPDVGTTLPHVASVPNSFKVYLTGRTGHFRSLSQRKRGL
jgi:hypothetical protein